MSLPSVGSARANQIALYPPSVPISRIEVAPAGLVEVCEYLKTEPELHFNLLNCITAVDYFEPDPKKAVKAGFEPAVPGFMQVELGDLEGLVAAVDPGARPAERVQAGGPTLTSGWVGTLGYVAPEQAEGGSPGDCAESRGGVADRAGIAAADADAGSRRRTRGGPVSDRRPGLPVPGQLHLADGGGVGVRRALPGVPDAHQRGPQGRRVHRGLVQQLRRLDEGREGRRRSRYAGGAGETLVATVVPPRIEVEETEEERRERAERYPWLTTTGTASVGMWSMGRRPRRTRGAATPAAGPR